MNVLAMAIIAFDQFFWWLEELRNERLAFEERTARKKPFFGLVDSISPQTRSWTAATIIVTCKFPVDAICQFNHRDNIIGIPTGNLRSEESYYMAWMYPYRHSTYYTRDEDEYVSELPYLVPQLLSKPMSSEEDILQDMQTYERHATFLPGSPPRRQYQRNAKKVTAVFNRLYKTTPVLENLQQLLLIAVRMIVIKKIIN
ncbi:hypothetical protein BDZ89DRAFT_1196066 [Hymenopellis radicata]|nr:hypothetical protein BDZ89DRAFT_1196066 [Hymenopellis radicata]